MLEHAGLFLFIAFNATRQFQATALCCDLARPLRPPA